MRSAIRFCITAGVALGGISVIIAAPAAPPLRDIQVPAVELSGNTHDNPDVNSPTVADLLQVMYGFDSPVVVQNITESDAAAANDGQPSNVPGLSDLLNLRVDPSLVPTPGDFTAAPTSPPPPPR
ncbi:MAG TPA: hypothetical protein VMC78_05340 [Mycobacterium sp.]|nr:hypothetical protein [Mycobacterium sp.]